MQPQLNIFVSKTNEWVAWTPEGFFDASEEGANYIGYHINRGAEDEASFISVESLYKSFYRPELIQKALRGESLRSYAKTINIDKVLADGLAPTVTIVTPTQTVQAESINLKLALQSRSGGGVGEVRIYRNGTLVSHKSKAVKVVAGDEQSHRVSLEEGENIFKVVAFNRANTIESEPAFVTIYAKTSYHHAKPKLFVLSVGIEEFERPSLKLDFPVEDAKYVAETLQQHSKGLFESVEVTLLTTKAQTTKEAIKEAFAKLATQVRPFDFLLVNFSSHGESVALNSASSAYYLLTSNVKFTDKENLDKTALSADDLTNLIGQIQAKQKILVLDTCYAGAGAENIRFKSLGNETNMKLLQRAMGSSLFASSGSKEKSMDGYKGHGIFTYFLAEGLKGASDRDNDQMVSINELKTYTENAVFDKAQEKGFEQTPYIRIESRDFPISTK